MFSLSNRVEKVKPSATLTISATAMKMREQGIDVISLSAGEPDFDTAMHIKQAAIKAINEGKTKYTPVDGTTELKNAIIQKFKKDNKLTYELNEILVSSGGKQSFYNLAQAFLNEGDEVLIPAPYWVSYPDMVALAGGIPMIVKTSQEHGYKINAEILKNSLSDKTKMVVLNSPSNPTGAVYSKKELEALAQVLRNFPKVLIVSDDMYEKIILRNTKFCNILEVAADLKPRTMVLNGVSKMYAMTGWRIGYAAGPENLIAGMRKVQGQSTSNACSISQAAAVAALTGSDDCIDVMLKEFKIRNEFVTNSVNSIEGLKSLISEGAFYSFIDITEAMGAKNIKTDVEFAKLLLEEAQVAAVPGSAFGLANHLRISFATNMENLVAAFERIKKFLG